jgi:ActR/RegA family two-component response regulator
MSERKELFVLVVASDRVVAATVATVLRAGGYLAATVASRATVPSISARMVVDAAVIDLPVGRPIDLRAAVFLQNRYPDCRIVLVCSPPQRDQAVMMVEETGLGCEFVMRPLSRAELLAHLAVAPGVSNPQSHLRQLQAA